MKVPPKKSTKHLSEKHIAVARKTLEKLLEIGDDETRLRAALALQALNHKNGVGHEVEEPLTFSIFN